MFLIRTVRQPDSAEQQTQAAERLKCRQVRVLDAVKTRQALGRRCRSSAKVAKAILDFRSSLVDRSLARIHQEERKSLLVWKQRAESCLRHQQLSLEDAVLKSTRRSAENFPSPT